MFDPVKLFEDIASARGLQFIYGSNLSANWEIEKQDLRDSEIVLIVFPFEESGQPHNGSISTWTANAKILVGRKFDVDGTISNLDETDRQKYDRRIVEYKSIIQEILNDLCASDVELIGDVRIYLDINKFDTNIDVMACEFTFQYDVLASNV
jgi:hypothetical protein